MAKYKVSCEVKTNTSQVLKFSTDIEAKSESEAVVLGKKKLEANHNEYVRKGFPFINVVAIPK